LALVEHPIKHINHVLPGSDQVLFGQNDTPDETIAKWCGDNRYVLVTVDSDWRGRWLRSGLLKDHGVEVVVFSRDVPGLQPQHATITKHLPQWQDVLERQPYGHRVWQQYKNQNRLRPLR
jgi:hypothetical protein